MRIRRKTILNFTILAAAFIFVLNLALHHHRVKHLKHYEKDIGVRADDKDVRANWERIWTIAKQSKGKPHFLRTMEEFHSKSPVHPLVEVSDLDELIERNNPDYTLEPLTAPRPLTEKLVQGLAINNTLIVTYGNTHMTDILLNFLAHLNKLGLTNYLVGALDPTLAAELVARQVPSFAMYRLPGQDDESYKATWGYLDVQQTGRHKAALAKAFSLMGVTVAISDPDTVWLENLLPYFQSYADADVLVASEGLTPTTPVGDPGLEVPAKLESQLNIGIMYLRHSTWTQQFVSHWADELIRAPKANDHVLFNDLIRIAWDPVNNLHPGSDRLVLAHGGNLTLGVLPAASFCNGHTFFIQKLYEIHEVRPMAVHATHQYGGNLGKRHRMREAMIFEDGTGYYTSGKFISMEMANVPNMSPARFLAMEEAQRISYHREGLLLQLTQFWKALELVVGLGRPVVLPKFTCYCDKLWSQHNTCRMPGALWQPVPFDCPLDHILDLNAFDDDTSEIKLSVKEHSFLDNPRMPHSTRTSKVTIYSHDGLKVPKEEYRLDHGGLVVHLPSDIQHGPLMQLLANYEDFQIWHFKAPHRVLHKLADDNLTELLGKRIQRLKPDV